MHFNINSYGRLYVCTVVDFGNSIRPAFYRHSHFEHCLKVSNWISSRLNGGLWNDFLYKKNHEIFTMVFEPWIGSFSCAKVGILRMTAIKLVGEIIKQQCNCYCNLSLALPVIAFAKKFFLFFSFVLKISAFFLSAMFWRLAL